MSGLTAPLVIGAVTSLGLVAVFLTASWLAGWYEERARRVMAAVRHGGALLPGFGAIHGTARPLDGRAGGLLATTTVTQVRFGGGAWRDSERATTGAPFALVLESGEEVEIGVRDAVIEGDPSPTHSAAFTRDVVGRIAAGDAVWATGVLSHLPRRAAGAYRSAVARRRMTAPRAGPRWGLRPGRVEITRASPLPRWNALAGAHTRGAYHAAGVLALIHVVIYRQLDRAIVLREEVGCASILQGPRYALPLMVVGVLALVFTLTAWSHAVDRAKRTF
jgi:hypothetical protein